MSPSTANDIQHFDDWAATYDRSPMQRLYFGPIHARMLSLLAGKIDPPASVLDIGCGTGRLLHAASAMWPQAKLMGADPAPQMILQAKRLIPSADFRVAEAESLPFADGSVDLVMSSMSFHHWANQQLALREIARVLRSGGTFCLADHTFPPARLVNERARGRRRREAMFREAGLRLELHRRMWTRFVLITVAEKAA